MTARDYDGRSDPSQDHMAATHPRSSTEQEGSVPRTMSTLETSPLRHDQNKIQTSSRDLGLEWDRPFVCNLCKRSYSRMDHLVRHHRAHTRDKPFFCTICGKGFSRKDLMKRHASNHTSDDQERLRQVNYSSTESRVAQACVACAIAKLKCEHDKPCKRCQRRGIACTFPNQDRHNAKTISEERNYSITVSNSNPLDLESVELAETQMMHGQAQMSQNTEIHNNSLDLQVTTPITFSHDSTGPSGLTEDQMQGFDDTSLAEFMQEVLMGPMATMPLGSGNDSFSQLNYSRDVFNFGFDNSLDFDYMDFSWIGSANNGDPISNFNLPPVVEAEKRIASGQKTPDMSPGLTLGAEAFQNSLWRFNPAQQDHGSAEEVNLSLPFQHTEAIDTSYAADLIIHRLEYDSRDRILGMLFGVCNPSNLAGIVTSFPPVNVLDGFSQVYLRSQLYNAESWIHVPTFRPSVQRPEWNAIVIAAGAILSPVPAIRKLGYAIQEAVRLAIPKIFEDDNRATRELQVLQAMALQLHIGLWSGNRRKMEIAESHAQPLITMLRREGRYRRARQRTVGPEITDDDETLDNKWRTWVDIESYKRLSFHTLMHDARTSIALLVRPLLSYTEVFLELPCSQMLWRAKDAHAWRDVYLSNLPAYNIRPPSLVNCVHDMTQLTTMQKSIDVPMSTSIVLHAMWSLVAEHRQLEIVAKLQSADQRFSGSLISSSWHQELDQLLDRFYLTVSELDEGMSVELTIIQKLYLMNMQVSFEELQLLAGKEGNEEAHRVYPILKLWSESRKSREAIWHAGQIVRAAASADPRQPLREFYAVALYHASLALWAYGMISLGMSRDSQSMDGSLDGSSLEESICLDSDDSAAVQRFISLKRGMPVIRQFPSRDGDNSKYARLDHPKAVMATIINILGRNGSADNDILPPLIENLAHLMRDLGNAAEAIAYR